MPFVTNSHYETENPAEEVPRIFLFGKIAGTYAMVRISRMAKTILM